jgi:Reverse transcriptase (RNA-dependent DNA polymerase)/RNase H-like domain found in reverse transcriptase/Integrase zinc binding domain/Integrase core domain
MEYVAINFMHKVAIVDTGATVNVISLELLEDFQHLKLAQKEIPISGLGGSCSGKAWYLLLFVFTNGYRIPIPVVAGKFLKPTLLLGMPFLEQAETLIDIPNRLLFTKYGTFTNNRHPSAPNQVYLVQSAPILPAPPTSETPLTLEAVRSHPDVKVALKDTTLAESAQLAIIDILHRYQNVWTQKGVGGACGIQHEIKLLKKHPVALPPRHIALKHQPEIDRQITEMLNDGVISRSTSPYKTYPVMVGKKDGSQRMAIDYRRLNEVTITDRYPIPNVSDLMQAVEGSKFFCSFDLRAGFWQISLAAAAKPYTAFSTHRGHYEFNVMPFGLKNAPATFQRWTGDMFAEYRYQGILVYIDDILVHAPTWERLIFLLEQCFSILHDQGAQVKLVKSQLVPQAIKYLGHIIQGGQRLPDPAKINALYRIKTPTCVKDVRSLLGYLNYYRSYLPKYAERTVSCTRLLRKGAAFQWTTEMTQAIQGIAEDLSQAILQSNVTAARFRLETDASDTALGAVLYDADAYEITGRATLPIMFLAKTLSPTEVNWDVAEREAYSIVWALEASDGFIRGREVEVYCDHQNLIWMTSRKRGKIARWCSRLTEYNVVIKYQKGNLNEIADFLSRMIEEEDPLTKPSMFCYYADTIVPRAQSEPHPLPRSASISPQNSTRTHPVIQSSKFTTRVLLAQNIPDTLVTNASETMPHDGSGETTHQSALTLDVSHPTLNEVLERQAIELPKILTRGFRLYQGRIFYLTALWAPPTLRHRILDAAHFSLPYWHPGSRKMLQIIRRTFCWEKIQKDIQEYIKGCVTCQRIRPNPSSVPLTERCHPPSAPFDRIYMDFWGPIKWGPQGMSHILLTIVDNHTKWAEAVPLADKRAETIARTLIIVWISRFGAPKFLVTDNDTSFTSQVLTDLASTFGIKQIQATPYHPQGNAIVESFHRTLKKTLARLYISPGNKFTIHEATAWALLTYRSSPHTSIIESPAYLTFGADIRFNPYNCLLNVQRPDTQSRLQVLGELRQELHRKMQLRTIHAKHLQQTTEGKRRLFEIGDWVLKEYSQREFQAATTGTGSAKLAPHWSHPLRVTGRNDTGYVGYLTCPMSNKTTTAYVDKVRFLVTPSTEGQTFAWRQSLLATPYVDFFSITSDQLSPRAKRPRTQTLTVRGGYDSASTINDYLDRPGKSSGPNDNNNVSIDARLVVQPRSIYTRTQLLRWRQRYPKPPDRAKVLQLVSIYDLPYCNVEVALSPTGEGCCPVSSVGVEI